MTMHEIVDALVWIWILVGVLWILKLRIQKDVQEMVRIQSSCAGVNEWQDKQRYAIYYPKIPRQVSVTPMSYREKQCQYCGTLHKKRGPFCSKTCSNKNRKHSDETKAKMSQSQTIAQSKPENLEKTWYAREKAMATQRAIEKKIDLSEVETDPNNFYLPPMTDDTPDGAFRAGGDLWFESKD